VRRCDRLSGSKNTQAGFFDFEARPRCHVLRTLPCRDSWSRTAVAFGRESVQPTRAMDRCGLARANGARHRNACAKPGHLAGAGTSCEAAPAQAVHLMDRMPVPLQVTFHGIPSSDAIEAHVRKSTERLSTFAGRITGCHVAVEAPHRHQQHGRHFRVRIDLTVPGGEIVVGRAPDEDVTNEDVYAAVDQAFDRMQRRLEDHVRRQRGDVKPHEPAYSTGRVTKLWSYEGYGFLETPEGGEVYFHRNSVLHHAFDQLKIGSAVQFVEEPGEKGPQASSVKLVG
jgi:ribosomal subunit interface protein